MFQSKERPPDPRPHKSMAHKRRSMDPHEYKMYYTSNSNSSKTCIAYNSCGTLHKICMHTKKLFTTFFFFQIGIIVLKFQDFADGSRKFYSLRNIAPLG